MMCINLTIVNRVNIDTGRTNTEYIKESEKLEKVKKIAQDLLEHLREYEDVQSVPIMIALYREEEIASPVPGSYVARTYVQGSDMLIGDWEEVNEENVLFPSNYAKENFPDTNKVLEEFGQKIADYFPNYVGYIGNGFYVDNDLKRLNIHIPIEFNGSSEIVGFT